jgi:hypothetical protein
MVTVLPVDMIETRTVRTKYGDDGRAEKFHTADVRTVLASVTGADPMPHRYSRQGQKWMPSRLRVDYCRGDGGPWEAGIPALSGYLIRKDGSVGAVSVSVTYSRWNEDKAPEWVTDFVAVAHPDAPIKPGQSSGRVGSVPVPK